MAQARIEGEDLGPLAYSTDPEDEVSDIYILANGSGTFSIRAERLQIDARRKDNKSNRNGC